MSAAVQRYCGLLANDSAPRQALAVGLGHSRGGGGSVLQGFVADPTRWLSIRNSWSMVAYRW